VVGRGARVASIFSSLSFPHFTSATQTDSELAWNGVSTHRFGSGKPYKSPRALSKLIDLNSQSPRIDYLSSLPNELLDDIFEHAYTESPPSRPLSKRLAHWFEKHLFRKVLLSSHARSSQFLRSLSAQPRKGKFVQYLDLPERTVDGYPDTDFYKSLFPLLPNLIHLESAVTSLLPNDGADHFEALPSLESLAFPIISHGNEFDEDQDDRLDIGQLACLESLPRLTSLTIYDWRIYSNESLEQSRPLSLPRLESLRIEGTGAEDATVGYLIAKCPSLRHLAIHSTWEDDVRAVFGALKIYPIMLVSLSVSIRSSAYMIVHYDEADLARFTQLRSLHLGDQCYDKAIVSTLRKLLLLVDIHLGQGPLEPDNLLPFVSGPDRLLFLKTIRLDADRGNIGEKISSPSGQDFDETWELERCPVEMSDWRLPDRDDDVTLEVIGLKRLIEVGKENGITVGGGVLSALQTVDDYHLEADNRAIIATYFVGMARLRQVRSEGFEDGFPPYSAKLGEFEIVETELPERDWFALDLRSVRK